MLTTGNKSEIIRIVKITLCGWITFNFLSMLFADYSMETADYSTDAQNFLSHDTYYIMGEQMPRVMLDILRSTQHSFSAE